MSENMKPKQYRMLYRQNLYSKNHINFQLLCKQLSQQTPLARALLVELIEKFKHIVDNEPNLLMIEDPALVIGDIHGQFYDLAKILNYANVFSPERKLRTKLLFLGDYVDRGINAVEVMVLLICLKIEYPQNIYMLRGNHESRIMTLQYNFKSQCCLKYSQEIYNSLMEAFDLLPLACIINNSYFCVHGGISDKMIDVKNINTIQRKQQIPVTQSSFCDFIWSDPVDNQTGLIESSKTVFNRGRDCSIVFGSELVKQFLMFNNLSTIIRAHQVFIEGFKTYDWTGIKSTPSVITIFSAPNYCGTCGNKAAVLNIENNVFKIKQFKQQEPEKYKFLAKFDVFSWTLPEIMKSAEEVVQELMESIIENYVPELKKATTQEKIKFFINYGIQNRIIKPDIPKKISSNIKQLTAEQQRSYLFNRSHQYYAQFQKLPKNH